VSEKPVLEVFGHEYWVVEVHLQMSRFSIHSWMIRPKLERGNSSFFAAWSDKTNNRQVGDEILVGATLISKTKKGFGKMVKHTCLRASVQPCFAHHNFFCSDLST
jgi:hypothetical protein